MTVLDHVRRLLAYDEWANREALASLRAARPVPDSAWRRFAHVLGTEWTWLGRLRRETPKAAVWPDLSIDDAPRHIEALREGYAAFLDGLRDEDLARTIAYVNTKGQAFSSTIGDVLTHVALHSAYHRGQVASDLRAGGFSPATTDFVHATREGLV